MIREKKNVKNEIRKNRTEKEITKSFSSNLVKQESIDYYRKSFK